MFFPFQFSGLAAGLSLYPSLVLAKVEHLVELRTAERVTIYRLPNGPGITMMLSVRSENVEFQRLCLRKKGWLGD